MFAWLGVEIIGLWWRRSLCFLHLKIRARVCGKLVSLQPRGAFDEIGIIELLGMVGGDMVFGEVYDSTWASISKDFCNYLLVLIILD